MKKKSASRQGFQLSSNSATNSTIRVRTRVRAFTLIELLVVIVIIGILATISVAQFNSYQERAREAVIAASFSQLEKSIVAARIPAQKYLGQISGGYCTQCHDSCFNNDLRNVPVTNACFLRWKTFLDKLMAESGINLSGFYRDPWGSPYLLDENEHEPGRAVCLHKDTIRSVGPDGAIYSGTSAIVFSERGYDASVNTDNSNLRIPFFDPTCNQ